jgi:ribonuclease HII
MVIKMDSKGENFILGIDEAGRGPIIGPMIMVGVLIDESKSGLIKELGAKDSKLLSKKKREELYEKMIDLSRSYIVKVVTNDDIDNALNSETSNLNKLELDTTSDIINELKSKYEISKIYVDCPSTNVKAYNEDLLKKTSVKLNIFAEHKADFKYPVVSAASIIAKVIRDNEIHKIKEKYNIDFGSGYLGDAKTRQFLEQNFEKYPIFRKTWKPYKVLIEKTNQKSLFEY